jgi:hypothetical protein
MQNGNKEMKGIKNSVTFESDYIVYKVDNVNSSVQVQLKYPDP